MIILYIISGIIGAYFLSWAIVLIICYVAYARNWCKQQAQTAGDCFTG